MQALRPALLASALLVAQTASAQSQPGFQLNRYEPTSAGEWSLAVDHPWYSSTRRFAAGLTLNYAHDPLVFSLRAPDDTSTDTGLSIQHQLLLHVDVAGSFLDRVLLTASLPVTLVERGNAAFGVSPMDGVGAGDPRVGALVRVAGQPYRGPISLSLGGYVWLPLSNSSHPQLGDTGVRVMPKLVLGGLARHVMWSATAAYYYRPDSGIGAAPAVPGNESGSEVQLGVALGYADLTHRVAFGPEALFSTLVSGPNAVDRHTSSLDLLVGIHHNVARAVQLSLGGGVGLLRQPGTPDGRFLVRLAYAPMGGHHRPRADRDGDGIADAEDACPELPGVASADARKHGCPAEDRRDRDGDGVTDADDLCGDVPAGASPDPKRPGCPQPDRDGDGVYDRDDICVDVPQGGRPDAARLGCPLQDRDGDGVADRDDICVDVAAGPHGDPKRPGCPDRDSDGDGVLDSVDQCRGEPQGLSPDPARPGCPLPDRDGDLVPDAQDACPDKAGAPSSDPKKHGCPGLVEMKPGQIVILRQVFFDKNKDTIQKRSSPVLEAVADVLRTSPQIRRVVVEGHTDDTGDPLKNTDLSDRRARSVVTWLVEHGVEAGRLDAMGFGPKRPIADNKTADGRAKNRRVEFRIVDPPPQP